MSDHPMDNIADRGLRFDFDALTAGDFVWSQSCPEFSIFINALGIHVPYFEKFLVQTMRTYRDELDDTKLQQRGSPGSKRRTRDGFFGVWI